MAIPFLKGIDVAGTVDLSNLTIDSAQGTDGQVLTSTGSGIAWEDASGGASLSGGAANKLAIWSGTDTLTNDTNLCWINDRLGIGTAAPGEDLHIVNTAADIELESTSSGSASRFILKTADQEWRIGSHSGQSNNLWFYNGTNANYRMVLSPDGNLGIGTTSPSQKLYVNGNATADRYYGNGSTVYYIDPNDGTTAAVLAGGLEIGYGSAGEYRIEVGEGRTGDGYAYIDFVGDTTYSDYGLRLIRNNSGANTSSQLVHRGTGNLEFKTWDAGAMIFSTTNSERMRITSGGNVGIGTTSPDSMLHLKSTGDVKLILEADSDNSGENDNPLIELKQDGGGIISRFGNVGVAGQIFTNSRANSTGLGSVYQQDLIFFTENSARVYIKGENGYQGRVGIGAATPSQILDVNGNVTANRYYGNGSTAYYLDPNDTGVSIRAAGFIDAGPDAAFRCYDGSNFRGGIGDGQWASGNSSYTNDLAIYASNNFNLHTGSNTPLIRVTNTGLVGIGTVSPTEKLHVSGNILATSFKKSGGTSSQFLKADGSVDSNTYLTSHPNISAATSHNNSGNGFIQDLTVDSNGHVTGIVSASVSGIPTNYLRDDAFDSGIGLYLQGGSFNAGTDTVTAPLVIDEEDFIYTKDGGYLRKLIGKTSDQIQIGQGGTSLITSINFLPGTAGNSAVKINSNTVWNAGNDGSGSGLDADLLDGQQGSYYDHRGYTVDNNYLGGYYVSGGTEKPNDAIFGSGKFKVAMLRGGSNNLGFGGTWNDVFWLSSYNGGDVKKSVALVSSKYDNTSLWIAKQNYDSSSWGTGYLFWNSGNDGSGSGLDADLLDGNHASAFAASSHTHAASDVTSGTFATARIPNLAASKITSGTFNAARIAHNSFDIGDTTAETGRSVHETGIYTFNRNNGTLGTGTDSAYYSVLAFGQGTGGSVQIAGQWTSGGHKLYWRSLRDTTDNWWDWKEIYHTTHKPTPSEIGAVDKTGDTMTGALTIDSTGHATVSLDRASTSYDNNLIFRTAGSIKWRLWQDGSDDYLYIRNEAASNNVMTWKNSGAVGINTGTPNATLHLQIPGAGSPSIFLQSSTNYSPGIYFDDSNTGTSAAGAITYLNATNSFNIKANSSGVVTIGSGSTTISATADIVAYSSDKRLKENVQPIDKPLNKVLNLEGVTYNWNKKAEDVAGFDTEIKEVGLFAQDVQKVLPEAVKLAPFDTGEDFKSKSGEDYLTVQYEKIVPLLVEAIKDQQKQIDELKSIINGSS